MSITRYSASADTTISNAFQPNLVTRATGSNMGAADSLEIFSIYGQATTSSLEASRVLIKFPIDSLQSDINGGIIPSNSSYFLNLYNVRHSETLPTQFTVEIKPVSGSWSEGVGLDMEEYTDIDYANWISGTSTTGWINQGGDYYTGYTKTAYFDKGNEDLSVNITDIVGLWLSGTIPNNGLGIMLSSSQESSTLRSYYTKKFSARSSEYWFKRPNLEVRYPDAKFDDRGNFFASSSLASASDNLNTLYLYNYVRGKLSDIPSVGQGNIYVDLYDSGSNSKINATAFTGGWCSNGIYSASVYANTSASYLYDVWYVGTDQFHTGSSITVKNFNSSDYIPNEKRIISITNLKELYSSNEIYTFRLYVRNYDWSPNIYTVATKDIEKEYLKNLYYRVYRVADGLEVIAHNATSSTQHTNVSYDLQGNYFKLDMRLFEPGYMYAINFYEKNDNNNIVMLSGDFKFRVE